MRLAFLPLLIGVSALTAFIVFLFIGPFHIVELPLDTFGTLIFDACLCLTFFLQHSVMIRKGVRTRIVHRIPNRYFGALFTTVTAVMLFSFVLLWQESSHSISSADGIFRWLLQGIFLAAAAIQPWIARSLGASVDVFGDKTLARSVEAVPPPPGPILLAGPYRWVRHPSYFTALVMIWSYPDLTADRLLLNVLFTAWIILGTVLEERDLIAVYGKEYRTYQCAVPMLIPYRVPRRGRGETIEED